MRLFFQRDRQKEKERDYNLFSCPLFLRLLSNDVWVTRYTQICSDDAGREKKVSLEHVKIQCLVQGKLSRNYKHRWCNQWITSSYHPFFSPQMTSLVLVLLTITASSFFKGLWKYRSYYLTQTTNQCKLHNNPVDLTEPLINWLESFTPTRFSPTVTRPHIYLNCEMEQVTFLDLTWSGHILFSSILPFLKLLH